MTVLKHNFDGGPDNTTITLANSAQVPGNDPFDIVGIVGTGTLCQYDQVTDRASAEFVMATSTQATSTSVSYVAWSTSMGAQTTIYTRWYAKFSAMPTSVDNDNALFMAFNSATHCCSVWMNNGIIGTLGTICILNGPGSAFVASSSTVVTSGVWHRFEFKAVMNASTGSAELRIYKHPDEDSDIPTETLTTSGQNFSSSTANQFRLGCGNPLTHQTVTSHSSWELNNTGFPGSAPWRAGKGVPGILANPVAIHTDVM